MKDDDDDDNFSPEDHGEHQQIIESLKWHRGASRDQIRAVLALVRELKSRIMARALIRELNDLKNGCGQWWDEWRRPPGERAARYHIADASIADRKEYLWARHCPDYQQPNENMSFKPFYSAKTNIDEQLSKQNNRRRVLRFSVPRGAGKGTISHLLLRRQMQQNLFLGTDKSESPDYKAAFVAHLSFSMEFSSVLKAMARFFARRIAQYQVSTFKESGQPDDLTSAFGRIKRDLKQKFSLAGRKSITEDDVIEQFIASREEEPRLAIRPGLGHRSQLSPSVNRRHRLDLLKEVINYYAVITAKDDNERVFVCLSGLDRICDKDGDAYNSVHRAFFRLLLGAVKSKDRGRNTKCPPMDLVLISGKPEAPICYLSEEVGEKKQKRIKSGDRQKYSWSSKTKRVLRKWHQLERFDWGERLFLTPLVPEQPLDCLMHQVSEKKADANAADFPDWRSNVQVVSQNQRMLQFLLWATEVDNTGLSGRYREIHHRRRRLHQLLWNELALSGWMVVQWCGGELARETQFISYITDLDRAASKGGYTGVLEQILAKYTHIDSMLPDYSETLISREELCQDGRDSRLLGTLLNHLALFALPVEPWVLLGCPMIYRELFILYSKALKPEVPEAATDIQERWRERGWMLRCIRHHLNILVKRGLVIPIFPAVNRREDDDKDPARFLFRRFSVHSRLREHLARHMRLSVPDEGDRNHHQISIYCDQPQDLPTPSADHFAMVKEILSHSIHRCRRTLWCAYQFNYDVQQTSERHCWDDPSIPNSSVARFNSPQKVEATQDVIRRVYAPQEGGRLTKAEFELAGHFGEILAVPQRLRGCFSLLRGTFSLGSMSRLDDLELEDNESPFDNYRDWLRSILNASVGVERNRPEIERVLQEEMLSDCKTEDVVKYLTNIYRLDEDAETLDEEAKADQEAGQYRLDFEKWIRQQKKDDGTFGNRQSVPEEFQRIRDPLYRDEIAWLYNERGLTALIQGKLFDALPSFNIASTVINHEKTPLDDTWAYHASERRIQLNYAIAQIERGNISKAREMLEDLAKSSAHVARSTPSQTGYFAAAYIALCDHLTGSLERARKGYQENLLPFVQHRQLRAVSIFNRHLASLHHLRGEYDEAHRFVTLAVNAASQAEQRDVQHLALVSEAAIFISIGKLDEALGRIDRATEYASKMGLFMLYSDAVRLKARLMMLRGEYAHASSYAASSVSVCTRNGMRLRKLSGLILYGEIQLRRGEEALGQSILQEAKLEAESIGYQTKSSHAANLLSGLSESVI